MWVPPWLSRGLVLTWYVLSRENQRQVAGLTDWVKIVTNERGLWANTTAEPEWKLDETEGPYRVRFVASPARSTLWATDFVQEEARAHLRPHHKF